MSRRIAYTLLMVALALTIVVVVHAAVARPQVGVWNWVIGSHNGYTYAPPTGGVIMYNSTFGWVRASYSRSYLNWRQASWRKSDNFRELGQYRQAAYFNGQWYYRSVTLGRADSSGWFRAPDWVVRY